MFKKMSQTHFFLCSSYSPWCWLPPPLSRTAACLKVLRARLPHGWLRMNPAATWHAPFSRKMPGIRG